MAAIVNWLYQDSQPPRHWLFSRFPRGLSLLGPRSDPSMIYTLKQSGQNGRTLLMNAARRGWLSVVRFVALCLKMASTFAGSTTMGKVWSIMLSYESKIFSH
ncbi:hypothetical protein VFPPC_16235 [Pochonia chlamydosporia 170]|uniref:Uncharacterized protein n=1 Tax=Pochonia chlamydosporia 170 TaxID=1380566 RepID=A0A179FH91_METCM|nr:hypothetical protein VFPPC_16235 [Pochonia chlamydosporia 170]OAQ64621.1 hypothetical protein VFPPC_16235 [Pochonia chlamydosporia 170]